MRDATDSATVQYGHLGNQRDRGDTMLMSVILIGFLMIGSLALISAGQAWNARREALQTASSAARAAAQITADEMLANGSTLDRSAAERRGRIILDASGHNGTVTVMGNEVVVVVTVQVEYSFPSAGFPREVTADATATFETGIG